MNHVYKTAGALVALSILAGFTSEQSGGKDSQKQATNFSGTLETHTGKKKEYRVENISIGRMIKDIRVFELPDLPAGPLPKDPHAGADFTITLKKGLILEVPVQGKTWSYKRNEKASKVEYVAIAITPCDQGEKEEYIVESTRHLFCQEIGACDPIAMRFPLSQVKRLVIEDSSAWEETRSCPIKSKKEKKKAVATPSESRPTRPVEDAQEEPSNKDKDRKVPAVSKEDSQK